MLLFWLLALYTLAAPGSILAQAANGPPLSLTAMMALTCCAIGLVVGVLILGVFATRRKNKIANHPQEPEEREE